MSETRWSVTLPKPPTPSWWSRGDLTRAQPFRDRAPLVAAVEQLFPVRSRLLPGGQLMEWCDVEHDAVVEIGLVGECGNALERCPKGSEFIEQRLLPFY